MTPMRRTSVEIPLKDSPDEVIELDFDSLPDGEEVLGILRQERAALHYWLDLALEYYKQADVDIFVRILEVSGSEASLDYPDYEKDQMRALDTLAAYYVLEAHKERNKERRREKFTKATLLYTTADKIIMYDQNHLLGRAYFCLLEGDKIDQADAQFNFVIKETPQNIPALLGKACIAFQKRDYKGALFFYRKSLKFNPNGPADVRIGMGHCFAKLGRQEKARMAFERALELEPDNVHALAAVAVLDMNTDGGIQAGVKALIKAYSIEKNNPMILNHLANHFFFKKDWDKAEQLAQHAFCLSENEAMRAESCYHMARSFHCRNDYEKAFQYYYQATQFAGSTFILPLYGLGQMYIYRDDLENAIVCFEKVLKVSPNNYETLKITGALYAHAETGNRMERREKARILLQRALEQCVDDVEVLIDLAQLLENHDPQESLNAYTKASELLKSQLEMEVPAEILNNIASLHFSLGNLEEAKILFENALQKIEVDLASGEPVSELAPLRITIMYNLARVLEALCDYSEAEHYYSLVLRDRPSYLDCYLRLGCIARDRGQIYKSSEWFKEALSVNQTHANTWSLIGNLHMSKNEWGPAQKKFEYILKLVDLKDDTYSLVALGNVWLETLFVSMRNKEKDKQHRERALAMFMKALRVQPKNIWAANGVGCVLAQKGAVNEARDIFAQVREATADFSDVWMNIAHIYVEQKQFVSAVQMYENCMKKFRRQNDLHLLQYLARAYFRAGKLSECKNILLKARHVAPQDLQLIFNVAFVLQRLATQTLKDEKSSLQLVIGAVTDLQTAQRYFLHLANIGDVSVSRGVDKGLAKSEAQQCSDLLKQAQTYVTRARQQDEEEQKLRKRQEEERIALKLKQEALARERDEAAQRELEQLNARRQEFIEKTRELLFFAPVGDEEKTKKPRGRGRKKRSEKDEFVNDSSDVGDWDGGEAGGGGGGTKKEEDRKRSRPSSSKKHRRRREQQRNVELGDESDDDGAVSSQRMNQSADQSLSAKQKLKVKSREFLSSASSSDGEHEEGQKRAGKKSGSESSSGTPPPPQIVADSDEEGSDGEAETTTIIRPVRKRIRSDSDDDEMVGDVEEKKTKSEQDEEGEENESDADQSQESKKTDKDSDEESS